MTMTGGYSGMPDRPDMISLLRRAVELGVTFFDTAEIYGSARQRGARRRGARPYADQVVIATKFAQDIDPVERKPRGRMLRPEDIAAAVDGSLRRLRLDVIDLYYQHRVNPDVPIEEMAGAVKDLITAGKVKHFGMSEAAADTIRRAHAVQPVTAIQSEYNLWWRRPEQGVLAACAELGIGFVPSALSARASSPEPSTPRPPSPPTTCGRRSSVLRRGAGAQPRPGRGGQDHRGRQGRHARADRAGLAAGPAAVDRAHPRHHQAPPARGEPRRRRRHPHRGLNTPPPPPPPPPPAPLS